MANPYFVAWRNLMDTFHQRRADLPGFPQGEQIDFVFDEQQSEKRPIITEWAEYVAERPKDFQHLYGQTPIFRDSERFMPLQAADLWAGWVRRCVENDKLDAIGQIEIGSWGPKRLGKLVAVHAGWDEEDQVKQFRSVIRHLIEPGRPIYDVTYR